MPGVLGQREGVGAAAVVTYYVSTPKWTVSIDVDDRQRIVKAAPITYWAIGKDFDAFVRTLEIRHPGSVKVVPLKLD